MPTDYEDGARAMREAALTLLPEQAHCSEHAEGEYLCMPCTVRAYTVDAIAAAICALPLPTPAAGDATTPPYPDHPRPRQARLGQPRVRQGLDPIPADPRADAERRVIEAAIWDEAASYVRESYAQHRSDGLPTSNHGAHLVAHFQRRANALRAAQAPPSA